MSSRQPTRKLAHHGAAALARTQWRLCVALFSALALVFLLSTAASVVSVTAVVALISQGGYI